MLLVLHASIYKIFLFEFNIPKITVKKSPLILNASLIFYTQERKFHTMTLYQQVITFLINGVQALQHRLNKYDYKEDYVKK